MIGRTNAGGGGGLNFQVVGGTTAPGNPKENTIWVNTATPITSYAFSATEPSSAEEGMVWITIGKDSVSAFNALKKNCIMVYPLATKQYINGEYVSVSAYCYQSGEWVQFSKTFDGYLFNNGSVNEDITGGWIGDAAATIGTTLYGHAGSIGTQTSGTTRTANLIDLTDYTTINVNRTAGTGNILIFVSEGDGRDKQMYTTDLGIISLDVSEIKGEHYIGMTALSNSNYTVDRVWLE